jgi:hypothetical protein
MISRKAQNETLAEIRRYLEFCARNVVCAGF